MGLVFGGLIWGSIADKWHCHRIVITLACIIALFCIIAQPTLSVYYGNTDTNRCPAYNELVEYNTREFNSQITSINNCSNNDTRNSLNNSILISSYDTNCTEENDNQYNDAQSEYSSSSNKNIIYGSMFFINFLFAFGQGCGVAFVDTATLRHSQLSSKERPVQYGRQRMFAPVGSVIGILTTNLVIDYFPHNNDITCYAGIFAMYGLFTILYSVSAIILYGGLSFRDKIDDGLEENSSDAVSSTIIKNDNFHNNDINNVHELTQTDTSFQAEKDSKSQHCTIQETENENNDKSGLKFHHAAMLDKSDNANHTNSQQANVDNKNNFWKDFIKTLSQFDILFFYLTVLISGLEYSQFTSFLFVYLKEMNAPTSLLTLSIIFSNVGSFVCLAYTHSIIKVLGGTWRAIGFTFLAYFVRYFGISLIRNPWLVLIFQPFHGVTATLFMASGMLHLRDTSPLQVLTTLVSIFNGMHFGLGTFIGSSISGVVYEQYGGRVLFRNTALLSIAWFCVLVVYILFKERLLRSKTQ